MELKCPACDKTLPPREQEFISLSGIIRPVRTSEKDILRPCQQCRERLKKALEMYPKNHGKKSS